MDEEILQQEEQTSTQTVETLLVEQNEKIDQLHADAEILIASLWLLCGIVVGAAVGFLVYRLWRS